MPIAYIRRTLILSFVFIVVGFSSTCGANASASSGYSLAQTYNGALRYLRVDLRYEVVERDKDAAYLIFQYELDDRKRNGAFEIYDTERGVRLIVKLNDMPAYHEEMLKDGLMKKLRADYGPPPAKAPPKEKAKQDDKKTEGVDRANNGD